MFGYFSAPLSQSFAFIRKIVSVVVDIGVLLLQTYYELNDTSTYWLRKKFISFFRSLHCATCIQRKWNAFSSTSISISAPWCSIFTLATLNVIRNRFSTRKLHLVLMKELFRPTFILITDKTFIFHQNGDYY